MEAVTQVADAFSAHIPGDAKDVAQLDVLLARLFALNPTVQRVEWQQVCSVLQVSAALVVQKAVGTNWCTCRTRSKTQPRAFATCCVAALWLCSNSV
jgi:hypothetical protein